MNSKQFADWLKDYNQFPVHDSSKMPLLMGILNVTSDSFFDGGQYLLVDKACDRAIDLIKQGADIIDIGGESTRPDASEVSLEDELARVIPVIKQLRRRSDVCISIDTYKPEVMAAAVEAGATMINDVNGLRSNGALEIAAKLDVPVCIMHMQGTPKTMQLNPEYPNGIVNELFNYFAERIHSCCRAGIKKEHIVLDPGFGFGKTVQDNLRLVRHLDRFQVLNQPLLLGMSRKSTIGALLSKEVDDRLIGSITFAAYAALKGVSIIRTHDVDETKQALKIIEALSGENESAFWT